MKEIKNKKVFVVVVLIMVLGVIGVTYAVTSTTDIIENLFNTKGYDVSVLETFESPDNWVPGTSVDKIIKAKNNGQIAIAVRISYTEEWKDSSNNPLPLVDSNNERAAIINFDPDLDTNWIKSTENGTEYYYYSKMLKEGKETPAFITSVTFNPNINGSTNNCVDNASTNTKTCTMSGGVYAGGTYKLSVNIETAEADSYKVTWNTDADIFVDDRETLSDYVTALVGNSYIDNTDPANNVRYIGANPDNYVTFNNEEWRIIGVFNDRVKLYRKASLGSYSWDSSASNVNGGYGVNEWSQADLMQELNGDYLNTSLTANTTWYNGYNNNKGATFNYTYVLSSDAQNLIDDAVWYLGSPGNNNGSYDSNLNYSVNPVVAYNRERSSYLGKLCSSGSSCNDGITRQPTWTGKVAIAYASDYAMATDGGSSSGRTACMSKELYNYETLGYCAQNSWMKDSNQWFIDPIANSSNGSTVYVQSSSSGYLSTTSASGTFNIHPTVYLKADVHFDGGTGTQSDPYIISE